MFNDPSYTPHSPNSRLMYSSIAFILLERALTAVNNKTYEQVVKALILEPVGMKQSMFDPPSNDGSALLPTSADKNWTAYDVGFYNPAGGLWSTPNDMFAFLQALLGNELLTKVETRAWLQPRALTSSLHELVGAP
jgi:CubicO group peptidase (beta-lactamase class C family)